MSDRVLLALPSKGAIADPTLSFLRDAGLRVDKPNERQYVGSVPAIPGLSVLFQRVKDVVYKVADGTVQLGITGLDVVRENPSDEIVVLHPELGYGHCQLVVAVPEDWVDVTSMTDLVEVASDFRRLYGRTMRVATTYAHMARDFFHSRGLHYFALVKAEGAIEAAPTIGYADIVVDLVQTGTTLRENHLRPLADGTIVEAQACLIGNRTALKTSPDALKVAQHLLEFIDAALLGRRYRQLTVNIRGKSPEDVAAKVSGSEITRGLRGPTIAPIFGAPQDRSDIFWYTVTLNVEARNVLEAVNHLRSVGSSEIVISPVNAIFLEQSHSFQRVLYELGLT
ncbi:MAG: ATP phosphoribosyltransferase [Chloroflexi bacterium]|nr:ATP phosphoribosyltransferase [Chloroflexota bacterium]